MRLEVRDYMRVSGKLLGLEHEAGALTQTERQAIVSFAQEIEKKFLGPLSSTICHGPSPTLHEIDGVHGVPDFKNGGAF